MRGSTSWLTLLVFNLDAEELFFVCFLSSCHGYFWLSGLDVLLEEASSINSFNSPPLMVFLISFLSSLYYSVSCPWSLWKRPYFSLFLFFGGDSIFIGGFRMKRDSICCSISNHEARNKCSHTEKYLASEDQDGPESSAFFSFSLLGFFRTLIFLYFIIKFSLSSYIIVCMDELLNSRWESVDISWLLLRLLSRDSSCFFPLFPCVLSNCACKLGYIPFQLNRGFLELADWTKQ